MMESFWGRMQVELLNRRRWKTRIELASAIHDYIAFHNTRRRHSALGMRTPYEIESAWTAAARSQDAQAGFARTAPAGSVDEGSAAGLSEVREQPVELDHQHLQLNNDQAA
jgi:hypothetical protein